MCVVHIVKYKKEEIDNIVYLKIKSFRPIPVEAFCVRKFILQDCFKNQLVGTLERV